MSLSEYQQLVAFLTERFTAIDQRFGAFDYQRLERVEGAVQELRAASGRSVPDVERVRVAAR